MLLRNSNVLVRACTIYIYSQWYGISEVIFNGVITTSL